MRQEDQEVGSDEKSQVLWTCLSGEDELLESKTALEGLSFRSSRRKEVEKRHLFLSTIYRDYPPP